MKDKGIWNCYRGEVRADIQKYCEKNYIKEEEFCFLNIYKWEDKVIQYSFDSRGKEEWIFKLPELVERPEEKVYILMEEGKNQIHSSKNYQTLCTKQTSRPDAIAPIYPYFLSEITFAA